LRETQRKPTRMPGHDYSQPGVYFITFCVQERHQILCEIAEGPQVTLTKLGEIVQMHVTEVPRHYAHIVVKRYVIMPDHIHMLVVVKDPPPTFARGSANAVIPAFVSTLKRYINRECGFNLWQRSYHDEIIYESDAYEAALQYIENNPKEWLEKHRAFL